MEEITSAMRVIGLSEAKRPSYRFSTDEEGNLVENIFDEGGAYMTEPDPFVQVFADQKIKQQIFSFLWDDQIEVESGFATMRKFANYMKSKQDKKTRERKAQIESSARERLRMAQPKLPKLSMEDRVKLEMKQTKEKRAGMSKEEKKAEDKLIKQKKMALKRL